MQVATVPLVLRDTAQAAPEATHDTALDEREAMEGFTRQVEGGEGTWLARRVR